MTKNEYKNLKIGDRLRNVEDNSQSTITSINAHLFYPVAIRYDNDGYFGAFNQDHIVQFDLIRPNNTPLPLPG